MTNYNKQAKDFLLETGTTLVILKAVPQKAPLWAKKGEKHGINYYCTIQNSRGQYSFDFWDSVANADKIRHGEKRETKPTAYNILACLQVMQDYNFTEFCDNFGYDVDTKTADKIFNACIEQDKGLRAIFSTEQLKKLEEIQ